MKYRVNLIVWGSYEVLGKKIYDSHEEAEAAKQRFTRVAKENDFDIDYRVVPAENFHDFDYREVCGPEA